MFDFLRDQVGLDLIVFANGSSKVRCVSPSHQDEDPSMHLYNDHARCFACGFHGDVTDVWAAMRGFDKPVEAALDLAETFSLELPEASPGTSSLKPRSFRVGTDHFSSLAPLAARSSSSKATSTPCRPRAGARSPSVALTFPKPRA